MDIPNGLIPQTNVIQQSSRFWEDIQRGSLQPVWLAAFYRKKLNKRIILQCQLGQSCTDIRKQIAENKISLRWIAALLHGTCIIYSKQIDYLVQDSDDFNNRLTYAFEDEHGLYRKRAFSKIKDDQKSLEAVISEVDFDIEELLMDPNAPLRPLRPNPIDAQYSLVDEPPLDPPSTVDEVYELPEVGFNPPSSELPEQGQFPPGWADGIAGLGIERPSNEFEKVIGFKMNENVIATSPLRFINQLQGQRRSSDQPVDWLSPSSSHLGPNTHFDGISPELLPPLTTPRQSFEHVDQLGRISWNPSDENLQLNDQSQPTKKKSKKLGWDEDFLIPSKLMKVWWDNPLEPPKLTFSSSYWTWCMGQSDPPKSEKQANIRKLSQLPHITDRPNKVLDTLQDALNEAINMGHKERPSNRSDGPNDGFRKSDTTHHMPHLQDTHSPSEYNMPPMEEPFPSDSVGTPQREQTALEHAPSQSMDSQSQLALTETNKLPKSCVQLIHTIRHCLSSQKSSQIPNEVLFSDIVESHTPVILSRCLYNLLVLETRGYISTHQTYGSPIITIKPLERIWDEQFSTNTIYSQFISPIKSNNKWMEASIPSETPYHRRMMFI